MNNTVLITGSTSGIGKAFADIFAEQNYNLVLVSRNGEKLEEQKAELVRQNNINVETVALNLSGAYSARELYGYLGEKSVSINILINNAGFNEVGSFLTTDIEKERQMLHLHTVFTTEITKLLLPAMCEKRFGKIVNLGSTGSYIPSPYDAVYSATKAYLLSFSKALHYELRNTGVSVTCLCPGATKTEFAEKSGLSNSLLFKLFVMKPEQVAKAGYHAMMKNKKVEVVGLYNKLLVLSSYVFPSTVINYLIKKMM